MLNKQIQVFQLDQQKRLAGYLRQNSVAGHFALPKPALLVSVAWGLELDLVDYHTHCPVDPDSTKHLLAIFETAGTYPMLKHAVIPTNPRFRQDLLKY